MMQKSTFFFTLLFVCLMITTSVVATPDASQDLDPQAYLPLIARYDPQLEALMALYHSTNGPNWIINDGWDGTGNYCYWYGVTCEAGQVKELILNANDLNGTIPPVLGNLSNLVLLYLEHNQLSGPIPAELGNLSNLSSLYLCDNQLSENIPAELGNLSNLYEISLEKNQLSGPIPAELGNMSNLGFINLGDNQLSGPIPFEILNACNLRRCYLNLSYNNLSGFSLSGLPMELGNIKRDLDLYDNNFSVPNPLPPPLPCRLNLSYNNLSGPIPPELGNLGNLGVLQLDYNQMSGPIPATLTNLSDLNVLRLNNNPSLVCWETTAARDWAISLYDYQGPTAVCS